MQNRPSSIKQLQVMTNHLYQPLTDVLHQYLMSVGVCLQFVFVFATAAACVASQAMISAAFSIIKQSIALGCFPHLTVLHVSDEVSPDVCCLPICCTCSMQCTCHYSMHIQFQFLEVSTTKNFYCSFITDPKGPLFFDVCIQGLPGITACPVPACKSFCPVRPDAHRVNCNCSVTPHCLQKLLLIDACSCILVPLTMQSAVACDDVF